MTTPPQSRGGEETLISRPPSLAVKKRGSASVCQLLLSHLVLLMMNCLLIVRVDHLVVDQRAQVKMKHKEQQKDSK